MSKPSFSIHPEEYRHFEAVLLAARKSRQNQSGNYQELRKPNLAELPALIRYLSRQ